MMKNLYFLEFLHAQKVRVLLLISLFIFPFTIAQDLQQVISEKKAELKITVDPKKKATIYSDLAWYYASVSVDSALAYGKKAITSATEIGDKTLLSQVYSDLGAVYFRNNDFKNSEKNYLKSYDIRKEQGNKAGIAKLNNNLASVYRNLSQPKKSIAMYLEALKYFESIGDVENTNVTKGNLGVIFKDLKNYNQSEKYLGEAIKYFEGSGNDIRLCENYVNLGTLYQLKKDYDKALLTLNKANEKCVKTGNTQGISYASRNLAVVYKQKQNDSASSQKLQESKIEREKFNSDFDLASLDIENATNMLDKGNAAEAEKKLLKLKGVFEKENSPEDLLNIYRNLSSAKSYLNQPDSANFYFQKYIAENDKINKFSLDKQTQELTAKYETAKKDAEILENKNKLFKRNIYIFSLLGFLLVGIGAAFSFFRNRRKNEKIRLQQEILHQQNLATKAVMNAEDNERKRMATHLHDGVGQLLSAINMNVEVLDDFKNDEQNFQKVIGNTKKILDEAMTDVRTLSHQIMPNMLIKNSLGNALRDLVEKTNSPKLKISLKTEGLDEGIDQNVQIVLYRVIQECINNVIKHAEASLVEINILKIGHSIHVEISDNGIGFNFSEKKSKSEGLGIENIKSRIEFLKGDFSIESGEGKGTTIKANIPI